MRSKTKILTGLVICFALGLAITKYNSLHDTKTVSIKEDDMFFKEALQTITMEDVRQKYPQYAYTIQLLEKLNKGPAYINSCLEFAKASNLTLDPFFLGQVYSPEYIKVNGYSDAVKEANFEALKKLIAQQFANATKQAEPIYTVYPGAPGVGEPLHLEKDFKVDVMNNKFPQNAIIAGPDLVVMTQNAEYRAACAMPEGEARTAAMVKAYTDARDFSNGATNLMVIMAVVEKLNVIHDSTATNDITGTLFDALKARKYRLHGKIFLADKDSRIAGLTVRANKYDGFSLATPYDAATKGTASFIKVADRTYENRFDVLSIYVQPENFCADKSLVKEPVEVARLDPVSGKIYALPEGKVELDRLLSKLDQEALKPEVNAGFKQIIQEWEANQPILTAKATVTATR